MTRIAVILHERLGNWARQLRPRLHDLPIRWFETRSIADLEPVLTGIALPVVLIDLGSQPAAGLLSLQVIVRRASDARVLVLDPEALLEVAQLARELGATHVIRGCVPPPIIASLLRRWIALAQARIDHAGWAKALIPDSESEPWSWLAPYLAEPTSAKWPCTIPGGRASRPDPSGAGDCRGSDGASPSQDHEIPFSVPQSENASSRKAPLNLLSSPPDRYDL